MQQNKHNIFAGVLAVSVWLRCKLSAIVFIFLCFSLYSLHWSIIYGVYRRHFPLQKNLF